MAISAATVWEVRASGATDNNGGGFVVGATGTDFSQQDAAQSSGTDLVVDAVTNTKVTSATHNFAAADVGNLIQITAGAGFTTGFYQVVSVAANAATLDRSPAATGTTGGTWALGGALATIAKLSAAMVASNTGWLKGAFTSAATHTFAQNLSPPSNLLPFSRIRGYGSVRGDTGHATLTLQTNTGLSGFNFSGFGWIIEQVDVGCGSLGTSTGIKGNAYFEVKNCKISNFASIGISCLNSDCVVDHNEVTGGVAGASGIVAQQASIVSNNYVHDNACTGISTSTGIKIVGNIVVNNSGASSIGISFSDSVLVEYNTVHNNGSEGLKFTGQFHVGQIIRNNLVTNNGRYGFASASIFPASPNWDGNAFFGNTLGTRNNLDSVAGSYAQDPYTNVWDVILTGSPYVGGTTGSTANFGLNNTAGAGAACRGAARPNTWPGLSGTTAYGDMGAVPHQDTGGSSGPVGHGRLSGGLQ